MESQEKKHTMHKDTLNREHRYLRRRLEQLTATVNVNKRRSVSESSSYTTASGASTTSSACSTSSSPSISESGTYMRVCVAVARVTVIVVAAAVVVVVVISYVPAVARETFSAMFVSTRVPPAIEIITIV